MRILTPFILAAFVFFCGRGGIAGEPSRVVELPRPNSGAFTFAQAEAKKDLILANTASKRLADWKNPYLGFAIHVTAEDTFTVYSAFYTPLFPDGIDPEKTFAVEGIQEIERSIIQFGNPHGVLITSDRPLRESKAFPSLLKALFVPSIQLFYVSAE